RGRAGDEIGRIERDDFLRIVISLHLIWWSMIFFRKPASTFRDHALMMRKLVWWAFPVVIAASALALPMGDAIAQQGSADRAVSVTPSRRMCFSDTLQVAGVVVPRNEVLVRPDREGLQIAQVLVEPGDTVVGGQVLARLIALDGQPAGQGVAVQAPA